MKSYNPKEIEEKWSRHGGISPAESGSTGEGVQYDPKKVEDKWQRIWSQHPELFAADDSPCGIPQSGSGSAAIPRGKDKEKKYILDMFPYPSGDGLHVGHVESYTATDIISRFLRMNGKNVLHPTGWDAFGLPAENYAIKTKIHPSITTQKAIATFKSQMKKLGLSYDWSREINSSNPEYYKWTQWFFLLLYKNGYAYRSKAKVNFCPQCRTVLANEQVVSGKCERCEMEVVQKDLEQWFFKITDFIEDSFLEARPLSTKTAQRGRASIATSGLLNGLDKIDWPESTKAAQKNWIGRSGGALIKFPIVIPSEAEGSKQLDSSTPLCSAQNGKMVLEVFTTRLDTIYGCTYCVIAPEHKLIADYKSQIKNYGEVEKYLIAAQNKTELERMEMKNKTGVEIKGIKAINPFTNEEVPIFIADYVLGHYGTGAVMAVPAHDERDFEFAKKYNLLIKEVVIPLNKDIIGVGALIKLKNGKFLFQERDKNTELNPEMIVPFGGAIETNESCSDALKRELKEEIDLKLDDNNKTFVIGKFASKNFPGKYISIFYIDNIDENSINIKEGKNLIKATLEDALKNIKVTDFTKEVIIYFKNHSNFAFAENGFLVNSEKYSGMTSQKAREEMVKWLEENNLGGRKINYKIRDWLVSRQRYWGAPIPIIYCDKCGTVPVPEKDLPVVLPDDVDFNPTGESPLVKSKKFHDVKCPKCGGKARRESDTMDTFICSSWYYFRYADPKNEKGFADKEKIKKWLPVDLYVGGAEHTVLHLLYARFFTKALHKLGYIYFDEPFLKLRHQGIILGEDNFKMSKSRGNVINPDKVIGEYGADALRMFEMFMGPLEDMKPWNTKGIVGISRFLNKVWGLQGKIIVGDSKDSAQISNSQFLISNQNPKSKIQNPKIDALIHKTIKKITDDIENLKFNTAISSLMILINELEKQKSLEIRDWKLVILLLSPFAPHISEELWQKLGHKESIFKEKWPGYDPALIKNEEIDLVIQVNGRVRDIIKSNADISEDEAKKMAMESQKVKAFTNRKEFKKVIFVKGKLINIVVS